MTLPSLVTLGRPVSAVMCMSPPLPTSAPAPKTTLLVLASLAFATTLINVTAPPVSPLTTAPTRMPVGATLAGSSPTVIRTSPSAAILAWEPKTICWFTVTSAVALNAT